jgi:hypothetical protein
MHGIERSLVEKFKGKPFAVLGVKVDGDVAALRRHNLPWRSVWDGNHTNLQTYEVKGTPTLFLIDHRGNLATQSQNVLRDPTRLERAIRQLVDEAEKDASQVAAE